MGASHSVYPVVSLHVDVIPVVPGGQPPRDPEQSQFEHKYYGSVRTAAISIRMYAEEPMACRMRMRRLLSADNSMWAGGLIAAANHIAGNPPGTPATAGLFRTIAEIVGLPDVARPPSDMATAVIKAIEAWALDRAMSLEGA